MEQSEFNNPVPLSSLEVLSLARKYITSGVTIYKDHFKKRMDERNVSLQDVIFLIETGEAREEPEWSNDYNEYNYYIEGNDIEGDNLTVKIALSTKNEEIIFITVF
jgi:hypothetical protein